MEPTPEMLAAFVDGALPPQDMERVAAIVAQRPDLDAYVRRQERLRAELQGAFDGVVGEPPPERLVRAARTAPISWRWRLRAYLGPGFLARSLAPAGAALALGLAVGLVIRPARDLDIGASGQLVAQGALGDALDRKLASAGYDGQGPRIGISFRDKAGADCRVFSTGAASGLACRQGGAWVIGALAGQAPESGAGGYRQAGSEMPEAIRAAVSAIIDGAPFDAAAERQARDRGWRGQ